MRLLCALLLVACSGVQKPPPGCAELDYGAIVATCGDDAAVCGQLIDEHQRECDAKIKAGQ